ncbi:MAG: glycosyl hydrolase family 28 protein [Oscillospiraceae bacterium]|nr:glycosyl hydrolase family 28 protein [Oscillospiraceae bacterium]
MRKLYLAAAFVVLILVLVSCESPNSEPDGENAVGTVEAYPFAPGMDKFDGMTVTAQGKEIELYSTLTNPKRSFLVFEELLKPAAVAMFDMTGRVEVRVDYPAGVNSVIVRPARAGIVPELSGGTVTFEISKPGQYSVEFNGDPETDNLMIFANPPAPPVPDGATVVEGRMDVDAGNNVSGDDWHNNHLFLKENEILYLKPGSVIYGGIKMASGSKVMGRGIITGKEFGYDHPNAVNAIRGWDAENLEVEGVHILDPNRWVVEFLNCDGVKVENIKIISARNNGDGITIQSTRNMTIDSCFIRSWDDSIVIKNYTDTNSFNITAKNCVIWTDLAQSLEIGFETNRGPAYGLKANDDPRIYDIAFEDIDIIHNFHKAPISIHNGDNCKIYDVTYKNIIVDNAQMGQEGDGWKFLIDFENDSSGYTQNEGDREIKDVSVENVWVLGGERDSCGANLVNNDAGGKSVMGGISLKNIYWKEKEIVFDDLPDSVSQEHSGYLPYPGYTDGAFS